MLDVVSVSQIDLNRYLGRWYEICRLPLQYEDAAATDITTTYTLTDKGKVRVDNRCFDDHGKPVQAVGVATPVDDTNARLKVNFLPAGLRWLPFTDGDYWILKVDPDYEVALVGTPDQKFLWVLARSPRLEAEIVETYLDEAQRQGFDLAELIRPAHTGAEVSDSMLEAS